MKADPFKDLTWDDLLEWAGATIVSRGQSYQRSRQVQELARTLRGGLIAWVQGTHRYATMVETKYKELISACTCPFGGVCKHAVAVVLDYLEHAKHNRTIPTTTEQDRRLQLLENTANDEEWDEEEDAHEADEDINNAPLRRSRKSAADTFQDFLAQ
ncbi:MAG: SWIM zinc finger family protein, partial [Nitrospirota bacterium]